MNHVHAIDALVMLGENSGCDVYVDVRTKNNGRTVGSRTAITSDLHEQNSTAAVASKSKMQAGPVWNFAARRVTSSAQKTTGRVRQFVMAKPHFTEGQPSDFPRQRKVVGSFRATQVADLPARVIRAVAATSWSKHCMLRKMWVSSLSHLVGMRAVERAEL